MPRYGGYGHFVNDLDAFVNQAIDTASREGVGYAVRQMDASIAEAVRTASRVTSQQLEQLADVYDAGIAPADRLRLHEELGAAGQRSVLASYDQTRGRSTSNPQYNRSGPNTKWRRYAGGRLRAALADREFYTATVDGLEFINVALLNKRAAQWARVNFGAGDQGRGSKPATQVTVGTLVVASLGLDEAARPAFPMPVGYWVGPDGGIAQGRQAGAAFFPYQTGPFRRGRPGGGTHYDGPEGRQRIPMTRPRLVGVEGRQFLDTGVQAIARGLGPGIQNLYKELHRRGDVTVRPHRMAVGLRPVR